MGAFGPVGPVGIAGPPGPAGERGSRGEAGQSGSVPTGAVAFWPKSAPLPTEWVWDPLPLGEDQYRIAWARLIGGEPVFPIRKV